MKTGENCHTFEHALRMALEMKSECLEHYLDAMRKVQDKGAREILRAAALNELDHKHQLEKAALQGTLDCSGEMAQPVPTMNLHYVLAKRELGPGSDARDALAYAIHLEKGAREYYRWMAQGCGAAPMASLFERLQADESRHLQSLEDLYVERFLTEN